MSHTADTWVSSRIAEDRAKVGSAELRWIILRSLDVIDQHDVELHERILKHRQCAHQSTESRRNELSKLGLVDAVGRRDRRTVHRTNDTGRAVLATSSPSELHAMWRSWRTEHPHREANAHAALCDLVAALDTDRTLFHDPLPAALKAARQLIG